MSTPAPGSITFDVDDTRLLVTMAGHIDLDIVTDSHREQARNFTPRRTVVDMSGVTFFDSSGVGFLVYVRGLNDVPVSLIAATPDVRNLLRVTGLQDMFIYEEA